MIRKHLFKTTDEAAKKFMADVKANKIIRARKLRNKQTKELFIEISFFDGEVKK